MLPRRYIARWFMFIAMKPGRGMLIAATMQYCVYSDVSKVSTVIHCASSESVGHVCTINRLPGSHKLARKCVHDL